MVLQYTSPKFPKPKKEMLSLLKFIIKYAKFLILNRPTKLCQKLVYFTLVDLLNGQTLHISLIGLFNLLLESKKYAFKMHEMRTY